MGKFRDLTGMKFGRLTVIGFAGRIGKERSIGWKVLCDCGKSKVLRSFNLTSGKTSSCGCLNRELFIKRFTTHGKHKSRAYVSWQNMRRRCYEVACAEYHNYGARGIKVCDRWRDLFENFYADMGDPPPGKSLDRIDVDGNYTPENCRWATAKEQANNKQNNRVIEYEGEELTIAQLAEKMGVNYKVFYMRLSRGWSVEEAATTPVRRS